MVLPVVMRMLVTVLLPMTMGMATMTMMSVVITATVCTVMIRMVVIFGWLC